MSYIILGIVIVNTVFSAAFAIKRRLAGKEAGFALYFFMLPVLGFLIYFISLLLLKLHGMVSYDRESLIKRFEIEQEYVMPEVEKELNIIPIEDAMAISSNAEKRSLLLEQLKKDINANYKTVLAAGSDSDSESAHYVAAAKMEVYRRKQSRVLTSKKEWEKDTGNYEALAHYLGELSEYIDSELLAEKEADIYKNEYCQKTALLLQQKGKLLTSKEYSCCLRYLLELKLNEKVVEFWDYIPEECKDEGSYMTMLKMYYEARDREMFYRYLDEIGKSEVKLSSDGLKMLRYWRERRV